MRIGIGLPTTVPGVGRDLLLDWCARAERGPFSTAAVLDRLVYDSLEPFAALSAAAAVTERIRLATMIAIGPLRQPAVLAKQIATVSAIAGGPDRLTVGLAVGARPDDYAVADIDYRRRGALLSDQLAYLRSGEGVAVHAGCEGVEMLVGGGSGAAFARVARYADGYAHGGGPPRAFAAAAARVRASWSDLGRPGEPRLWGQAYFTLGDADTGRAYLRDYYAFTGGFADTIAAANLVTARQIRDLIRGYEAEGCDELILLPTVADADDIDRLAEVIG